jgi:Zn-finger nucleic acid-binding protein
MMSDMMCPWCETELELRVTEDEQTCARCGTTWLYEDEPEVELLLAA